MCFPLRRMTKSKEDQGEEPGSLNMDRGEQEPVMSSLNETKLNGTCDVPEVKIDGFKDNKL